MPLCQASGEHRQRLSTEEGSERGVFTKPDTRAPRTPRSPSSCLVSMLRDSERDSALAPVAPFRVPPEEVALCPGKTLNWEPEDPCPSLSFVILGKSLMQSEF